MSTGFFFCFALAIMWDIIALNRWPHHDYTISGFVYRLTHHYPVTALAAGVLIGWYVPATAWPVMVTAGLAIHFTWKA